MKIRKFLSYDWDAIAGIIAAVAAIVLHFLHIINEEVLITLTVVLIALLFLRDLRRERNIEEMQKIVRENQIALKEVREAISLPDTLLVGPDRLRSVSRQFCIEAQGDMIWFHVCLSMFKPQSLFDTLLKPALENTKVSSIQFILDEEQRKIWESDVLPKINQCERHRIVNPPHWTKIDEKISFILSNSGPEGKPECLLSFWGEPFMSRSRGRDIPRYIFRVLSHSDLIPRLIDLERSYRLQA